MKNPLASLVVRCLLVPIACLLVRVPDSLSQIQVEQEKHLQNLKQLTFGGQNAEAYFSYDGTKLIFQSTRAPFACDQIFSMNVDGSDVKLLSRAKGRTICGFFFLEGRKSIYASTHAACAAFPPAPDRSKGYV